MRFTGSIPRIERAELVVADEARRREQPRGICVSRLTRERRRCQIPRFHPSALHHPQAGKLTKDGRTRT
jgi:hypothetical protein